MEKIIVIHYDGIKEKFVFHQPGAGLNSIFIDFLIIKNVSFFILPECADIIRERGKSMSKIEAKFPHAFAAGVSILSQTDMALINLTSEKTWQEIQYDVFTHNSFVVKGTGEPIVYADYFRVDGQTPKVLI